MRAFGFNLEDLGREIMQRIENGENAAEVLEEVLTRVAEELARRTPPTAVVERLKIIEAALMYYLREHGRRFHIVSQAERDRIFKRVASFAERMACQR